MKHNCDVVKDLLPLYQDDVCSEASKVIVEEHLEECSSCREMYEKLKNTVYDKLLEEQRQGIIKTHDRKERNYSFLVGASIAGILMIPVLICLICNLAIGHALDWFFIVLTSLLLVASLTVVPLVCTEKRLVKTVAGFTVSLILLLATCNIYTKGNWFWLAVVPVLFSLSLVFTPVFLHQCNTPAWMKRHKGLISMLIDTVLLYAVIVVCGVYAKDADYWGFSLVITTVSAVLPWMMFVIIRYAACNKIIKIGLCTMITGIYEMIINPLIGLLLQESGNPYDYINTIIGVCILLCGGIIVMIGLIRKK